MHRSSLARAACLSRTIETRRKARLAASGRRLILGPKLVLGPGGGCPPPGDAGVWEAAVRSPWRRAAGRPQLRRIQCPAQLSPCALFGVGLGGIGLARSLALP